MSEHTLEVPLQLTAIEAWADHFEEIAFSLPDGCNVRDAVIWLADQNFPPAVSRITANWDELINQQIGVFGERRKPDDRLQCGDRIEFYRALTIDPKLARSSAVEIARRKARQARDERRLAAKTGDITSS